MALVGDTFCRCAEESRKMRLISFSYIEDYRYILIYIESVSFLYGKIYIHICVSEISINMCIDTCITEY